MINKKQVTVEPNIKYLTQITESIEKGEIFIPEFQRPFVWKKLQMLNLFDSVYNGYPIGNLVFWKTTEELKIKDKLGFFELKNLNNTQDKIYVIDGHQRLTTLFSCLYFDPTQKQRTDVSKWDIVFDCKDKTFLHKDNTNNPLHYPINQLQNSKVIRRQLSQFDELDEKQADEYSDVVDSLANRIKTYKIPITYISGGDLGDIIEMFARLNSEGTKMHADYLTSAITYSEELNTSKEINVLLKQHNNFFKYVADDNGNDNSNSNDRNNLFRALLYALDLNVYMEVNGKQDIALFKKAIEGDNKILASDNEETIANKKKNQQEHITNCVERWKKGINLSVNFIQTYLKIPAATLLPYNLQFLSIYAFFMELLNNKQEATEKQLQKLTEWFWVGAFSGMNNTNSSIMKAIREEARNIAKNNFSFIQIAITPATPVKRMSKNKFVPTAARAIAFTLFYIAQQPHSLKTGKAIEEEEIQTIFNNDNSALAFICEIKDFDKSQAEKLRASIANRIIVDGGVPRLSGRKLLDLLLYWENTNPEALKNIRDSHLINDKAYLALKNGDYAKFVEERFEFMQEQERIFMESKGVTPPTDDDNNDTEPELE